MIRVEAPAKINLFLRVLGKRSDGYHELASLFQTLDFYDTLELELASEDQFTCTEPVLQNGDNLCVKALALFRQRVGKEFFVKTHLAKRIPREAGLGGGSSNAAAMLKGVNRLLNEPLDPEILLDLAQKLGSDVPFFLSGGAAYCTGRGEIVKKVKPLEEETVWIVKPSKGLLTPEVYRHLNLASLKARDPLLSLQEHIFGKGEYYNDLEEAAFSLDPSLRETKNYLLTKNFKAVLLAGSGSALVCIGQGDLISAEGSLKDNFIFRTRFH